MDGSWVHAWLGSVIMRERERLTFSLGVKISGGCGAQHDIARWSNLRISCIVCAVFALKDVRARLKIFFNVWDGF